MRTTPAPSALAIGARALVVLAVSGTAGAALAQETGYLDDRSTPDAVVRSLYDAVNRKEWTRAYGYVRDTADRPDFASFRAGYADTASVRVHLGQAVGDSGMSQTRWTVPTVIEATGTDGAVKVFSGCYTLHLTQPLAQIEPPFRPIEIESGHLQPVDRPFASAEGRCDLERAR